MQPKLYCCLLVLRKNSSKTTDMPASEQGRRRSSMTDIVISYASEDRKASLAMSQTLTAIGYSVWFDRNLMPGTTYSLEIEERIRSARVTIVLWSNHSVKSPWVISEAQTAHQTGNYFPVKICETTPPNPFNALHTVNATWSDETEQFSGFEEIVVALHIMFFSSSSILGNSTKPNPPDIIDLQMLSTMHSGTLTRIALRQLGPSSIQSFAEAGDPIALWLYGALALEQLGVSSPQSLAAQYFDRAAKGGVARAQFSLGMMFLYGMGVPVSYEDGLRHVENAAANGIAIAQFMMGQILDQGNFGVESNPGAAFNFYLEGAIAGAPDAKAAVAWCYYTGRGTVIDPAEAYHWFNEAAQDGHGQALAMIGAMYADGDHLHFDAGKAMEYFIAGFNAGYTYAALMIGDAYANGSLTQLDTGSAISWWRRAADAGIAEGYFNIASIVAGSNGELDYLGIDVRQEYSAAAHLAHGLAAIRLGELLKEGRYGPKNMKKAKAAFEKAKSIALDSNDRQLLALSESKLKHLQGIFGWFG